MVEDEPAVLEMAVESLGELGYRTITATRASEALDRLRGPDRIDILFSDVVMPGGMNGVQLSVEARRMRPGLRVLLTSGYTATALDDHSVPADLPLLNKPYQREDLANKMRIVLAEPDLTLSAHCTTRQDQQPSSGRVARANSAHGSGFNAARRLGTLATLKRAPEPSEGSSSQLTGTDTGAPARARVEKAETAVAPR